MTTEAQRQQIVSQNIELSASESGRWAMELWASMRLGSAFLKTKPLLHSWKKDRE